MKLKYFNIPKAMQNDTGNLAQFLTMLSSILSIVCFFISVIFMPDAPYIYRALVMFSGLALVSAYIENSQTDKE